MPRKTAQKAKGEVVAKELPSLGEILGTSPQPPEEDNEPTLDDVGVHTAVTPTYTAPGFAMADDEGELDAILNQHLPPQTVISVSSSHPADLPTPGQVPDVKQPPAPAPTTTPKVKKEAPKSYQFVSRIQVTDVYRFDGQVHKAPDWVSREWASYDEGPTLYIPEIGATARMGDRVVKQDVNVEGEVVSRLAVYSEDLFNQLFMPA